MSNKKLGYVSPIGEFNSPKFGVFTESAGYRTAKQQIESFMFAGRALEAARSGNYDSDDYDPVDDPSIDVREMELSELGQLMQRDFGKVVKEEEKPVSSSFSSSLDTDSVNTEPEPEA